MNQLGSINKNDSKLSRQLDNTKKEKNDQKKNSF